MKFLVALAVVAATATTIPASAATNLVQNGGFGVLSQTDSWAVNKTESAFMRISDLGNGEGLLYIKDSPVTISQGIFSGPAGTPLSISFDYQLQGNDPSRVLSVLFGGQTIFSTSASTVVNGADAWATKTVSAVATGYDQLSFVFDTHSYAIALDNVSVSAVPEANSMVMLSLGLAGLAWVRLRQQKR